MTKQKYDFYIMGVKSHSNITLKKAISLLNKTSKYTDRCYYDLARDERGNLL